MDIKYGSGHAQIVGWIDGNGGGGNRGEGMEE